MMKLNFSPIVIVFLQISQIFGCVEEGDHCFLNSACCKGHCSWPGFKCEAEQNPEPTVDKCTKPLPHAPILSDATESLPDHGLLTTTKAPQAAENKYVLDTPGIKGNPNNILVEHNVGNVLENQTTTRSSNKTTKIPPPSEDMVELPHADLKPDSDGSPKTPILNATNKVSDHAAVPPRNVQPSKQNVAHLQISCQPIGSRCYGNSDCCSRSCSHFNNVKGQTSVCLSTNVKDVQQPQHKIGLPDSHGHDLTRSKVLAPVDDFNVADVLRRLDEINIEQ